MSEPDYVSVFPVGKAFLWHRATVWVTGVNPVIGNPKILVLAKEGGRSIALSPQFLSLPRMTIGEWEVDVEPNRWWWLMSAPNRATVYCDGVTWSHQNDVWTHGRGRCRLRECPCACNRRQITREWAQLSGAEPCGYGVSIAMWQTLLRE